MSSSDESTPEDSEGGIDLLKEAIYERLILIDRLLAVSEVPLKTRPIHAAARFVTDWVLAVRGTEDNSTDNFYVKPWFAIIYHHVDKWYEETYGAAFQENDGGSAVGVVLIRDHPVALRVPLTTRKVETPGETFWLGFPVDVEEDEDPASWLVSPPNLERLEDGERAEVLRSTASVARGLRSIRTELMGIASEDEVTGGLLAGVLAEVESAAANILRGDAGALGAALWSLQMAMERMLKALAHQKLGRFTETHDLFRLFDEVADHLAGIDRMLLKKLPRSDEVISDRYGLNAAGKPTTFMVVDAYNAALALLSAVAGRFTHKIRIGGGRLLLQRPPWTVLPSPDAFQAKPSEDDTG